VYFTLLTITASTYLSVTLTFVVHLLWFRELYWRQISHFSGLSQ